MLTTALTLIVAAPVAPTPPLQSPGARPAAWEMTLDDLVHTDSTPESTEHGHVTDVAHFSALAVRAADFDCDGDFDVVLGGNGSSTVRVRYLEFDHVGHDWTSEHTEVLDGAFTTPCYDLDVGDVDGDGFPDVAVGRRQPEEDSIFINTALSCSPPDPPAHSDHFDGAVEQPLNPAISDPGDPGYDPIEFDTFSIKLADMNDDGMLDLVSAGNYGIRYYEWDGSDFVHRGEYEDPDDEPGVTLYRQMAIGDIDGDDDLDLVVPRAAAAKTKAWFNRLDDPVAFALEPFEVTTQPGLEYVDSGVGRSWWPVPCQTFPDPTIVHNEFQTETFEVALGDLDGDGDLDLFAANNFAENCVYLNDGDGFFGGDGTEPANSQPSHVFPSPTADFFGPSDFLDFRHGNDPFLWNGRTPAPPFCCEPAALPLPGYCEWYYTYKGWLLDRTTGVTVFDQDDDGTVDLVGFSNRNDWEESFTFASVLPFPTAQNLFPPIVNAGWTAQDWFCMYEYISEDPAHPVPPTYDHLYTNRTPPMGTVAFDEYVELVGRPNDGTSYGEFVNLNGGSQPYASDFAPEWLDANWANLQQDGSDGIYWGLPLQARSADQIDAWAGTDDPVEFELSVSLTQDVIPGAGTDLYYQVLVSGIDMNPATDEWPSIPIDVPLFGAMSLTTPLSPVQVTHASPQPGAPLELDVDVAIARSDLAAVSNDSAFFCVVFYEQTGAAVQYTWASNALRMPLVEPAVPVPDVVPSPFCTQ